MRKLLALLLAAGFSGAPALATDYFFSSCSAGCEDENPCNATNAGTIGNPYCLDPGTFGVNATPDGKNESVMILFDGINSGANKEATAGDTIYLCAANAGDDCDGSGMATFPVDCTGTAACDVGTVNYWFKTNHTGPISIRRYSSEVIVISGDQDQNGALSGTTGTCSGGDDDLDVWITNCGTHGFYDISFRDLTFEKTVQGGIWLDGQINSNQEGANGWEFNGIVERYVGREMWADNAPGTAFADAGCTRSGQPFNIGGFGIRTRGVTGTFTVKNSIIHSVCGSVHRDLNNDFGTAAFLYENNEYYNLGDVADAFNFKGSYVWRGNYIHDCAAGISFQAEGATLEDNRIECLGQWQVFNDGRCADAVHIATQTNPGLTHDITARRNKIFSVATTPSFTPVDCCAGANPCASPNAACGWFLEGIQVDATCGGACPGGTIDILIENNLIWHRSTATTGEGDKGDIFINTDNDAVTVRANTSHGGVGNKCISLKGSGRAYTVVDNLCSSPAGTGIWLDTGVLTTNISFNDAFGSDPVFTHVGGTNRNCSSGTLFSALNTGNKCVAPSLVNTSGAFSTWDLHLQSGDTAAKDAGTAGPTDDIDKQTRSGTVDIGADEIASTGGAPAVRAKRRVVILKSGQ